MLNTVIIGYGNAGRNFHSPLVALAPGLVLHGIASRDAATRTRVTAERGCRAYECFEQVLDDPAVHLVILATPHDVHAEQAVRAMEAGKHVVTDKVMCLNSAECERMIDASGRTGRFLSVFHNRRFDGDFLTLRRAVDSGQLGEVKWLEQSWGSFGPSRNWRSDASRGGGRLLDLGAHMLDQALLLFPQPVESVYCRMHHDFSPASVESQAMVIVTFEGGRTAIVDATSLNRIPKARFHARGDRATFTKFGLDPQEDALKRGDVDSARNEAANDATIHDETGPRKIPTIPGRWRDFYDNVAAVLLNGEAPAVKLDEMRRLMRVLDAARESARTGQSVCF